MRIKTCDDVLNKLLEISDSVGNPADIDVYWKFTDKASLEYAKKHGVSEYITFAGLGRVNNKRWPTGAREGSQKAERGAYTPKSLVSLCKFLEREFKDCGDCLFVSGDGRALNDIVVENGKVVLVFGRATGCFTRESVENEETKMKKLNITKERFEKSNYFQGKYGKLEYVSESGKLFKTNKGQVLMFKEYVDSGAPIPKTRSDGACDNLEPGEYGLSKEWIEGIGTRYVIYIGGSRPGEMFKLKTFGARQKNRAEEVLAGLQDGSIDEKNLKYVSENGKILKFKESFNDMDVDLQVGDRVIIPARCFPKGVARQQLGKKRNTAQRGTVDEITDDRVIFQLDNGRATFFPLDSWEIKQIEKINESTKKFGKKFNESIKDIAPGIQDWGSSVYIEKLDAEMSWKDLLYIVRKDCKLYPNLEKELGLLATDVSPSLRHLKNWIKKNPESFIEYLEEFGTFNDNFADDDEDTWDEIDESSRKFH